MAVNATIQAALDRAMANAVCAGERYWVEQAINVALEVAAEICEVKVDGENYGHWGGYGLKVTRPGVECAKEIRALKMPVPGWVE